MNRPEVRARMSARFSGAGSNFWRGGTTAENKRLRQTQAFREWRRAVFTRDDYTCQSCGLIGGTLHPHHLQAFAQHPELRFDVANGQTLCEICHRQTGNFGNRAPRRRS
jgi:5-methylcytosine-specific restriction endonuclease McrA